MKKSSELQIDLNIKNFNGSSAFHQTCINGRSETAEMILKNSSEVKIDLKSKDYFGRTAFHLACLNGRVKIVDMMIEQSEKFDLRAEDHHLNIKYSDGWTVFQRAC